MIRVFAAVCVMCYVLEATAQENKCEDLGGTCTGGLSDRRCSLENQVPMPGKCPDGATCCVQKSSRSGKRIYDFPGLNKLPTCRKTTTSCSKHGGKCTSESDVCNTQSVNSLCNQKSCTCCLGDNPKCKVTPKCRFQGGFCIKRKTKLCHKGEILEDGCEGRDCFCCVSERQCSCGLSLKKRIVGGTEVKRPHKYPWMVGIKVPYLLPSYLCGGTIINDLYILTAAHCLFDDFTGRRLKAKHVILGLGDHDQFSLDEDTSFMRVKEIIIHERYDYFQPYDDIALLRLRKPLEFNDKIQPACLPTDDSENFEDWTGYIYGWGTESEEDFQTPDLLHETSLPIWGPDCGNKTIGDVRPTTDMICAGRKKGGRDTCIGDSGGPLTVRVKKRHFIVGITSFGEGCGKRNTPGVYMRVSSYIDWIMNHTADASYCY